MAFLREKSGHWSPEKITAFAVSLVPAVWLLGRALLDDLGPRPVTEAIHFSGRWSVRLLFLSLAITPARRLFPFGKLILARRTLGVAAALYAVFHFLLYVADQKFNLATVASEIALRFYLTIGFVALLGFIALAVTSTDAMIRRLGARWNTLHKATYVIAVLAVIHFMLQKKLDIYEPVLMAGLLLFLFGYRLWHRLIGPVGVPQLLALSVGATALTALVEALWYAGKTGVNALMVLEANLMFDLGIRPMWWVLVASLALTLASFGAHRLRPRPVRGLRPAE